MNISKEANKGGKQRYEGGCHCNAVRFEVQGDLQEAICCNCSICTKKGFLHLIVEREDFRLLQGEDFLEEYTFGTHTAKHRFCRRCGIHSFYVPRSHPQGISVNIRCLSGVDLGALDVRPFDGHRWEKNIGELNPDLS